MPGSSETGKDFIKEWFKAHSFKSVLDVGPGWATYSKLLRTEGVLWNGVEIHEPYIEEFDLKSHYDKIFVSDIVDFKYQQKYDVIIFGDIIEHISKEEAKRVLLYARSHSNYIIISIPLDEETGAPNDNINAKYWDNPYEIHFSRWCYNSFSALLAGCGFTQETSKRYKDLGVFITKNESSEEIILCNNYLTSGCLGEKVMWSFLLERIPNLVGIDRNTVSFSAPEIKKYIDALYPSSDIIIQNASFMDIIDSDRYTIAYLQDNFRAMGNPQEQQESLLKKAKLIVSNSMHTAKSYPEYKIEIIPIGIDDMLFNPSNKQKERFKNSYQDKKTIGIFVGSFDEVKGWAEVLSIVQKRKDIFWIFVSKDGNSYSTGNSQTFNMIKQDKLASLLNCADFFIVGSPVETQCLAAVEACFCNVPIVMRNTGIFADFSDEDKNKIGYIGDNLEEGVDKVLSSTFNPLEVVLRHGLSVDGMIIKWIALLNKIKKDKIS
jgi:hypothetical protein